jgi:hypothetical protein
MVGSFPDAVFASAFAVVAVVAVAAVKFATSVVELTTKGAVPVAMVEVYCVAEADPERVAVVPEIGPVKLPDAGFNSSHRVLASRYRSINSWPAPSISPATKATPPFLTIVLAVRPLGENVGVVVALAAVALTKHNCPSTKAVSAGT